MTRTRSNTRRTAALAAPLLATLILVAACGGTDGSATAAPSTTDGTAELADTLSGILESHRAGHEFVGAVLAVREADGDSVTVTSGTQTVDAGSSPVDADVPWNIGSVTKTFVAVVTLQLAEEGRLDLDAGIEQYLPDLAGADRITPRRLLQHTSGLGEYQHTPEVDAAPRRAWTFPEILAVAEAAGRTGEPGGAHSYSNTNYMVLGEIVQQVTGSPWEEAVRDRILEPLGMRNTQLVAVGGARGYGLVDGTFVDWTDREHPSLGGPAGGLESTAADLLVYTAALADGRLLSDRSTEQMSTFLPGDDLSQFGVVHEYGLGLERYTSDQVTVHGHLGSGAAHSAFIGFDPESGAEVAVLMNSQNAGPQAVMALEALTAVRG